jgi:hypothetical protein
MRLTFLESYDIARRWIGVLVPPTELRWALATPPTSPPATDCDPLKLAVLAALAYAVAREDGTSDTLLAILAAGPDAIREWLATLPHAEIEDLVEDLATRSDLGVACPHWARLLHDAFGDALTADVAFAAACRGPSPGAS